MDTVFNINRFVNLEKRNISLSKMQYIYIASSLAGLYILSMLLHILTGSNFAEFIYFIAYVVIVGGPCFFEKNISKHSSIFDFTLPTSTFEDFLSIWIKYVILIPVSIFLVILILNFVTGIVPIEALQEHAKDMSFADLTLKKIYKILAFQSIFMLGYFFFRRYAFAKTTLIMLMLLVILTFFGVIIGYLFFKGQEFQFNGNMEHNESFNMGYTLGRSMGVTEIKNDLIISICGTIISIIMPIGAWVVSYMKLKETEI
ncbi:nitrogen fixation-related uncharacterized protein [Dysgonomonas hofstadii]|uniref:Nitrogen fixation-related uncharacterized protein n=1 Tax=Dysgonomonas hofstadii TaxID=637886 RepID=A0A840CN46_9BACT|nr:hypothetical protein [Dysgonomonas hofstadii]MBB4036109.1 nitrogen fixation-related uncharacterized protein [Dysgonomonas hofstadii]